MYSQYNKKDCFRQDLLYKRQKISYFLHEREYVTEIDTLSMVRFSAGNRNVVGLFIFLFLVSKAAQKQTS